MKLWDITSLGRVQVVVFFDVVARLRAGDGPITALVGGSCCSIGSALQHRIFNDYKNNITAYTFNEHRKRKIRRRCPVEFMKSEKCYWYHYSIKFNNWIGLLSFLLVAAVAIHRQSAFTEILHYAPPVTTRVAAVAPPKSHNFPNRSTSTPS